MTDSEPGGAAPGASGPPARPPGPAPDGYVPREWLQPDAPPAPASTTASTSASPMPPMPPMPPVDPTFTLLPPPPSILPEGDLPFLDTPWVPPQTRRQGWMWLIFAVCGFLVGQLGALIFGYIAGAIAGKTAAQMTAIASASVPPEWYVVSTLLGLWIGFIGAPWLASRTQGTRHFF
ncbi:MAG TPA: hypothetical protein VHS57_03540, partial [Acidimicrobiales bacterium]|nr:hypothetical protein [Acidimicrobiales bacterium]